MRHQASYRCSGVGRKGDTAGRLDNLGAEPAGHEIASRARPTAPPLDDGARPLRFGLEESERPLLELDPDATALEVGCDRGVPVPAFRKRCRTRGSEALVVEDAGTPERGKRLVPFACRNTAPVEAFAELCDRPIAVHERARGELERLRTSGLPLGHPRYFAAAFASAFSSGTLPFVSGAAPAAGSNRADTICSGPTSVWMRATIA